MRRRNFLKLIGCTIVAPALPKSEPKLICLGTGGQVGKKEIKWRRWANLAEGLSVKDYGAYVRISNTDIVYDMKGSY